MFNSNPKNNGKIIHNKISFLRWLSNHPQSIFIVAIILCCTGLYIHGMNAGIHCNSQPQIQQVSQENVGNQDNHNQSQPKQTITNFLSDMSIYLNNVEGYRLHGSTNPNDLAQYYLHGMNNQSFKLMIRWCNNQSRANSFIQVASKNIHSHRISNNEYEETYHIYCTFRPIHTVLQSNRRVTMPPRYIATEHTLVKRLKIHGNYRWFIVNSNSIFVRQRHLL